MNRIDSQLSISVLWLVFLTFGLGGCSSSDNISKDERQLRERAEIFGFLLLGLHDASESEAIERLEGFIEPTPDKAERIIEYYREFSGKAGKFKTIDQFVADIEISTDGVNAKVTYRTLSQAGRLKIPVLQATKWRKVEGEWYRVVGRASVSAGHWVD